MGRGEDTPLPSLSDFFKAHCLYTPGTFVCTTIRNFYIERTPLYP